MARKSTKNTEADEEPKDQIDAIMADPKNKDKHYGQRSGEEIQAVDKISTGSFRLDMFLDGGFRSSCWARFSAQPESGKTSMSLCWGKQWQDFYGEQGMVIFFNAEGRITPDLVNRSGIDTSKNKFRILDSNKAEFIWDTVKKLISDNPNDRKYFFVIDSLDACIRDCDIEKSIGDAEKIGGAATILSAAGKNLSLPFSVTGHFLFMCSQVRDNLKSAGNPHAKATKEGAGGNPPKFYSSLSAEIKRAYDNSPFHHYGKILENPSDKKSDEIGRMTSFSFLKTPNEKTGVSIIVPIKYGLKGGVWRTYEGLMTAVDYGFMSGSGSSYKFTDYFCGVLSEANIEFSPSFVGVKNARNYFDEHPELSEFIFSRARLLKE